MHKGPSYVRSKAAANTAIASWLGRAFPDAYLSPRFDPLFADGPTRRYVAANSRCRRAFRNFDPLAVRHVGVISAARGGSHLLGSQFHFLERAFCFGEGFTPVPIGRLNYRAFLLRGMFFINSLQDKDPKALDLLFYTLNATNVGVVRELATTSMGGLPCSWIFNFRNPLRVAWSRHAAGKRAWQITETTLLDVLDAFAQRLALMRQLSDEAPERVCSVMFEAFVGDPERHFARLCRFLGLTEAEIANRPDPRSFFKEFARCGSRPVERDGYLTSPVTGEIIQGWGGGFNPIAKIDAGRVFDTRLTDVVPPDLLAAARESLGEKLFEICVTDHEHRFRDLSPDDFAAMLPPRAGRR